MQIVRKGMMLAAAVALVCSSLSQPAKAQFSWTYWQITTDPVHCEENALERRMIEGYLGGALDPIELAELRRDLDGVKDREEVYRMSQGLDCKEQKRLLYALNDLKCILEAHMGDKKMLANISEHVIK